MWKPLARRLAFLLARSPFLEKGRRLHEENPTDYRLGNSAWNKAWAGLYLACLDYSRGEFPPRPADREATYASERHYYAARPEGIEETFRRELLRPFWMRENAWNAGCAEILPDVVRIMRGLEACDLPPPARVLELGCGSGWMAEFLALLGYDVVGTTINPQSVDIARQRIPWVAQRGGKGRLRFLCSPMESVDEQVEAEPRFDAVFVYEALHHAFSWEETIRAAYRCLKPGGFFLICNEPNRLHTLICYRSAKILGTHEIGFKKSKLLGALADTGFRVVCCVPRWDNWLTSFWIRAQRPKQAPT